MGSSSPFLGPAGIRRDLGQLPCSGWPVRPGKKSAFEYTAAELFIRYQFGQWFPAQYKPTLGCAVTWQLDYLFWSYDAERFSPEVAAILKYMRTDFVNASTLRQMETFRKARESGKLTERMLENAIGFIKGFRKPDMCGITGSTDPARIELVEVSTEGQLAPTRKELQEKIAQLRTQVVPPAMAEILARALQGRYTAATRGIEVAASPFRPSLRVCPLPVPSVKVKDMKGNQVKGPFGNDVTRPLRYDWICFEPTFADPSGTGEDGLVLYHIHTISLEELQQYKVPPELLRDAQQIVQRWYTERRGPQLLPELLPVWTKYERTFDDDTMRLFAYGAAGLVAILALASLYGIAALTTAALAGGAAAGGAAAEGAAAGSAVLEPQLIGFVAALGTISQVTSDATEAAQALSGFAQAGLAQGRK